MGRIAGGIAGLTGLVTGSLALDSSIPIRVWFSEAAAGYENLRDRVTAYLEAAFAGFESGVDVSIGGTVSVSTEDGYRVTASGEWPAKLTGGLADGSCSPVCGVNLLLTDGSMEESPTGLGVPHVASVGGARHVAEMPPWTPKQSVLPYSDRVHSTQVLIHECGHALGLRHDHGRIIDRGHAVVVTPMVGGYAWETEPTHDQRFDAEASACGSVYPGVAGKGGYLDMTFSDCAMTEIREGRIVDL